MENFWEVRISNFFYVPEKIGVTFKMKLNGMDFGEYQLQLEKGTSEENIKLAVYAKAENIKNQYESVSQFEALKDQDVIVSGVDINKLSPEIMAVKQAEVAEAIAAAAGKPDVIAESVEE